MAALDPVIDRVGGNAETCSDLVDAQLAWFESTRRRHPADVADPFDGGYVECTTETGFPATCVELCDQFLIACGWTQLEDECGSRVRCAFGFVQRWRSPRNDQLARS